MKLFFFIFLCVSPMILVGQAEILGTWKAVDDADGQATSHIEIESRDGQVFGKIVKLLEEDDDIVCEQCEGANWNKPVLGLEIITNMKKDGSAYKGGRILDPENGKTYKCRLKLVDDVLEVRGYIGIPALGRTQKWYRVN